jgi:hypothetical protein
MAGSKPVIGGSERGMEGEDSIHVVGVGVGVRLVDADEYEESRADRRHYSPLHLRPTRRSIQGSSLPRLQANCDRAVS